ncbi:uncharacterized protein [Elaeis guineensis]|uniref:Uncharacterized protein LOC105037888 isoform X6 n=1 Tax=Elaeis guineensis var. tenera TaxID=51953 RepID=A0A8N4F2V5_ELAGV|nr:uncharacterized protein LOC105037888 isoform X6 [Elaeis guineensis]
MAAAVGNLSPAAILGSVAAARLLPPRSTVSFKTPSLLTRSLPSLRPIRPPGPQFQVRAARTESGSVSLGFRAPYFELPEPLTGKVWKLDDFEPYPALLKGLAVVAISSNSTVTHPQSQDVARAFGAVCTPEFFLFKKDGRRPFELFYRGRFDDSRPSNNVPITGRDLSLAIDCALSGQQLSSVQKPSVGCSIKWHPEKSQ